MFSVIERKRREDVKLNRSYLDVLRENTKQQGILKIVCYSQTEVELKNLVLLYFSRYLMKDQLKGASSVEAYINAFKRGCKCVERKSVYNPSRTMQHQNI